MTKRELGRKILVAGQGGKSTLARAQAADLNLPYFDLDAISHLPNWVARDPDDFKRQVKLLLEEQSDGWVIDGNYAANLEGMVVRAADSVVFVNLSWSRMMWRIFWRTIDNIRNKRVICGENVDSWRRAFCSRDSLLWFLLRRRKQIHTRVERTKMWIEGDTKWVQLDGAKALNEFYDQQNLTQN
jgi:adenylate kinase family enzyme